jgi:hypothetical protein
MCEGMIQKYDEKRKYGWIASPTDYIYFHLANCLIQPALGMIVGYEKAKSYKVDKGEQAINVRLVGNRCEHTINSGSHQCDLRDGHTDNHFSRSADIFWKSENSDAGVQL